MKQHLACVTITLLEIAISILCKIARRYLCNVGMRFAVLPDSPSPSSLRGRSLELGRARAELPLGPGRDQGPGFLVQHRREVPVGRQGRGVRRLQRLLHVRAEGREDLS